MRPKCLPRLQERLQPRQNPWPTFRVLRICRIVLRPLIVRDHNLHRFSLRSQLYLDPRHYCPLAHAELVLEQRRCLHPQPRTRHIALRLAILPGPRPTHRPARLEVHVEIRAHKDGLVRLLRYKSVPDLLDRGRNIESETERWLRHLNPPDFSTSVTLAALADRHLV